MVKLFFDLRLLKEYIVADAELPVTLIPTNLLLLCHLVERECTSYAFVTSALLKAGPVLVLKLSTLVPVR
jgi:hypothetical protein